MTKTTTSLLPPPHTGLRCHSNMLWRSTYSDLTQTESECISYPPVSSSLSLALSLFSLLSLSLLVLVFYFFDYRQPDLHHNSSLFLVPVWIVMANACLYLFFCLHAVRMLPCGLSISVSNPHYAWVLFAEFSGLILAFSPSCVLCVAFS